MASERLARVDSRSAGVGEWHDAPERRPESPALTLRETKRGKSKPVAIIRIARFWPATRRASAAATVAAPEADGLDAFGSEDPAASPAPARPVLVVTPLPRQEPGRPRAGLLTWLLVVLATAVVTAGGTWAYQRHLSAVHTSGQLTVHTTPSGLEVSIGGEVKGRTPLTLDLLPGAYAVSVGSGAQQRVLNATIVARTSLVERLEVGAPAAATGALRVETDPAGLSVLVDGVAKGSTPLTVAALTPGEHQVVIAGASGPVGRTVSVRADETVSLIVAAAPAAAPAATAGWLAVTSSVPLQFRQDGKVIGTTQSERVMLPAGQHAIEFVNEGLGYREQRRVSIAPGGTTRISLAAPKGRLSINAQPWADVWLDGERLGVTPIGNLEVPIGSHELVFRHPEHGERRSSVSVGLQQASRVGVDMRKK